MHPDLPPIPVTVLTGFLGSGKTTLLNYILSANHGKRIAVIENEFGEVGVDQDLVIRAEEEIFEMNNGCICCTVRGDLIRILSNLIKRRDRFDHILIETTGLADPGPVAQTFFVDDELKRKLRLDGIVTVIDLVHVMQHIDTTEEVKEQIAFADVLLLNKSDLVSDEEILSVQERISRINGAAKLYRTERGAIELDKILGIGGFNLERALEVDPSFMEAEFPFEWAGVFNVNTPDVSICLNAGPDESITVFLKRVDKETTPLTDESFTLAAAIAFSEEGICSNNGALIEPGDRAIKICPQEIGLTKMAVKLPSSGTYALFTEHYPDEFGLKVFADGEEVEFQPCREFKPDHEHDEEITSVGLEFTSDMDAEKLERWLSRILRERGADIFRMKGVFSVAGEDRRLAFQGVHMLLNAERLDSWGSRERRSSLIFIGKGLNRDELEEGLLRCLA
jgi:G3E family GTPase